MIELITFILMTLGVFALAGITLVIYLVAAGYAKVTVEDIENEDDWDEYR